MVGSIKDGIPQNGRIPDGGEFPGTFANSSVGLDEIAILIEPFDLQIPQSIQ